MTVDILNLILSIEKVLKPRDAEKIRGYLGKIFWDNPFVHHHTPEGSFLYKYPRVQYKVIKGNCLLISFNEGNEILKKVFDYIQKIQIEADWREILCKALSLNRETFGFTDNPVDYLFLTPWLALNQENIMKYRSIRKKADKKWLLEKILIGNLLSIAKSLGYTVLEPLKANITNFKEVHTKLKGTPMLGFLGSFSVNFEIPDYWGIGKSVSRGFGTIVKKENLVQHQNSNFKLFTEPPKNYHKRNFKKKTQ